MTAQTLELNSTTEVPRSTYTIQYSPQLVRTGKDFYGTLEIAAKMAVAAGADASDNHLRLSTEAEEQYLYSQKGAGAKKLSDVPELKDYFGNNDGNWYAWGWTLTGLRVPEEYVGRKCTIGEKIPVQVIVTDISQYISQIADPNFERENWKDIIAQVNRVQDEILVPYSRGHVVKENHPAFGIFTEIEETTEHSTPYALHAWLRENLDVAKDPISGNHDLAVARRAGWHRDGHVRCLGANADYGRWRGDSYDGFRPVRGSVPESSGAGEIDRIRVEDDLLKRMRKDYQVMPPRAFQEKYQL